MQITKKKVAVALGATTIAVAGSGVAFAYWTSTGSGSGSATSSSGGANLTVSQTNSPTGLGPGIAPTSVTGTITNGAANSAYVKTLTVSISSIDSAHSANCSVTDFGLSTGSAVLAKSSAVQTLDLDLSTELGPTGATNDQMSMPAFNVGFANDSAASQDGCKGAVPALSYSVHN